MKQSANYFSIRTLILGFALITPVWAIIFFQVSLVLALVPVFASHLLLLYPTLTSQSQWWGPVVRSFATKRHEVWLTIDDGPDEAHTEKILDLLDRFNARATFFVVGERALKFPHLLERILARGHQIANHTLTHSSSSFWIAPPFRISNEIDRCDSVINLERNWSRLFFRAPAGLKNMFVHPALAPRGMSLIGWTVRGFDTSDRAPEIVAARILKQVEPGAIILLHEGHRLKGNADYNPACVELTLRALAERGYQSVIPRPEQLRTHLGGR